MEMSCLLKMKIQFFGKIIEIDKPKKTIILFLLDIENYSNYKDGNYLISSEHGPSGGD